MVVMCCVILLSILPVVSSVQCMSSANKPVDWFIVYKLPFIKNDRSQVVTQGYEYMYMDATSASWTMPQQRDIRQDNQAVGFTLRSVYHSQQGQDFMHLMYSDQPPDGKKVSSNYGHSKGTVAFDRTSGFWLIHSTPRFPAIKRDGYRWPDSANKNGQSFLCISLSYTELNTVAKQLLVNTVYLYDSYVPSAFTSGNPDLADLVTNNPPPRGTPSLVDLQGNRFHSFAKDGTKSVELYAEWVAPTLKIPLFTETWRLGGGNLDPYCSGPYQVYNVKAISLQHYPFTFEFTTTKDHSKWAISANGNKPWVCIGDINRQNGQLTRGGGTTCFTNSQAWNSFYRSIADYEGCSSLSDVSLTVGGTGTGSAPGYVNIFTLILLIWLQIF